MKVSDGDWTINLRLYIMVEYIKRDFLLYLYMNVCFLWLCPINVRKQALPDKTFGSFVRGVKASFKNFFKLYISSVYVRRQSM